MWQVIQKAVMVESKREKEQFDAGREGESGNRKNRNFTTK